LNKNTNWERVAKLSMIPHRYSQQDILEDPKVQLEIQAILDMPATLDSDSVDEG
jgi:hypothetical protein